MATFTLLVAAIVIVMCHADKEGKKRVRVIYLCTLTEIKNFVTIIIQMKCTLKKNEIFLLLDNILNKENKSPYSSLLETRRHYTYERLNKPTQLNKQTGAFLFFF